jgi:hypothetical protein
MLYVIKNAPVQATGIAINTDQNTGRLNDHMRFTSHPKPEKVVKAPHMPTNRNKRRSPVVNASTGPAIADPMTFTVSNPQGNTADPLGPAVRTVTHRSTRYLIGAPIAAPKVTAKIAIISAAVH